MFAGNCVALFFQSVPHSIKVCKTLKETMLILLILIVFLYSVTVHDIQLYKQRTDSPELWNTFPVRVSLIPFSQEDAPWSHGWYPASQCWAFTWVKLPQSQRALGFAAHLHRDFSRLSSTEQPPWIRWAEASEYSPAKEYTWHRQNRNWLYTN